MPLESHSRTAEQLAAMAFSVCVQTFEPKHLARGMLSLKEIKVAHLLRFTLNLGRDTVVLDSFLAQKIWGVGFLRDGTYTAKHRIGMKEPHSIVYCLVDATVVLSHEVGSVFGKASCLITVCMESRVAKVSDGRLSWDAADKSL